MKEKVTLRCEDCVYYAPQDPVEGMYVCHRDTKSQTVTPGYWCRHHARTLGRLDGTILEPVPYGPQGQHDCWSANNPDEAELLSLIRDAWLRYLMLCRDWKLVRGEKDET